MKYSIETNCYPNKTAVTVNASKNADRTAAEKQKRSDSKS